MARTKETARKARPQLSAMLSSHASFAADGKRRKLEELAERRSSAPAPAPVQARAPATPEVADAGLAETTEAFVAKTMEEAARHIDIACCLLSSALRAGGKIPAKFADADPDDETIPLILKGQELSHVGSLGHIAHELGRSVAARKRSR